MRRRIKSVLSSALSLENARENTRPEGRVKCFFNSSPRNRSSDPWDRHTKPALHRSDWVGVFQSFPPLSSSSEERCLFSGRSTSSSSSGGFPFGRRLPQNRMIASCPMGGYQKTPLPCASGIRPRTRPCRQMLPRMRSLTDDSKGNRSTKA